MSMSHSRELTPIAVRRWPSEEPLLALAAVVAALLWVLLTITVVGLAYALMVALFFGVMRLALIAHIRGSAVRLGPNQLPELYASVEQLALRMNLTPVPEAYVMQAGGALNAFATRFLRSNMIVLYSDLLDACGESTAARDMIIAHELGHIRSGHLRWHLFLLPAAIVPFLMSALSRAREFTCDRYGLAGAGDADGAGLGLAILAAGAVHGPRVNRAELVRQRALVETSGLMTVGKWLATHPPLSVRLAAIDPALGGTAAVSRQGAWRAATVVIGVPVVLFMAGIGIVSTKAVKQFRAIIDSAQVTQSGRAAGSRRAGASSAPAYTPPPDAARRARSEIARVADFINRDHAGRPLPWNTRELYQRLDATHPGDAPVDPYDGNWLGYDMAGDQYVLYSSGPDGEPWTEDDIRYDSRLHGFVVPQHAAPPTEPAR